MVACRAYPTTLGYTAQDSVPLICLADQPDRLHYPTAFPLGGCLTPWGLDRNQYERNSDCSHARKCSQKNLTRKWRGYISGCNRAYYSSASVRPHVPMLYINTGMINYSYSRSRNSRLIRDRLNHTCSRQLAEGDIRELLSSRDVFRFPE